MSKDSKINAVNGWKWKTKINNSKKKIGLYMLQPQKASRNKSQNGRQEIIQ